MICSQTCFKQLYQDWFVPTSKNLAILFCQYFCKCRLCKQTIDKELSRQLWYVHKPVLSSNIKTGLCEPLITRPIGLESIFPNVGFVTMICVWIKSVTFLYHDVQCTLYTNLSWAAISLINTGLCQPLRT